MTSPGPGCYRLTHQGGVLCVGPRDQWSNAYWSFAEIIAYASRGTWVSTGDVFGCGTCGYGCLAELRVYGAEKYSWLEVGDEVACEVEHLGRIANRVVAWAPLLPLRPG